MASRQTQLIKTFSAPLLSCPIVVKRPIDEPIPSTARWESTRPSRAPSRRRELFSSFRYQPLALRGSRRLVQAKQPAFSWWPGLEDGVPLPRRLGSHEMASRGRPSPPLFSSFFSLFRALVGWLLGACGGRLPAAGAAGGQGNQTACLVSTLLSFSLSLDRDVPCDPVQWSRDLGIRKKGEGTGNTRGGGNSPRGGGLRRRRWNDETRWRVSNE